jgi:hypothetical protein
MIFSYLPHHLYDDLLGFTFRLLGPKHPRRGASPAQMSYTGPVRLGRAGAVAERPNNALTP